MAHSKNFTQEHLTFELRDGRFSEYTDIGMNEDICDQKVIDKMVSSFTYPWQATGDRVRFVEELLAAHLPMYRGMGTPELLFPISLVLVVHRL